MVGRTAHLFDLGDASAISRRLTRASRVETEEEARPGRWQHGAPVSVVPVDFEALIESSATASELWERLLDWAQRELAARGVFVLDQHGFVIAARSQADHGLPPEVFSAVFAEGLSVLEPYLESGQRLQQQEIRVDGLGWISISQHDLAGAPVLFCVWRDSRLRSRRIGRIWRRIAGTVALYDDLLRPAAEHGGGEPYAGG